jgi:hypothetical protein
MLKKVYELEFKIPCILICTLFFLLLNQNAIAKDNPSDISLLSLNDIAYLWPTPKNRDDVDALINAEFLINDGGIWPEDTFNKVIYFAENKVNGVDEFGNEVKINFVSGTGQFENQLKKRKNWKVVGFRVDPSAPSTSPQVINQLGSIPQIRLILQPVTVNEAGVVTVHDYTAHLPFNFILNSSPPFVPDKESFSKILHDLLVLKKSQMSIPGSESMDGPLKVNNNLSNYAFSKKVETFLHDNLSAKSLLIIAFMGIATSDQWIFFDFNLMDNTHTPNSQLLHVNPGTTNGFVGQRIGNKINANFVNCNGISTAVLFDKDVQSKLNTQVKCLDSITKTDSIPLVKDIPNIIANPLLSNVLNTDCVSCHTESTRRSILTLQDNNTYQFQLADLAPFVMDGLLPTDKWNVRNFGWFTKDVLTEPKPIISSRTANEIASSLEFIRNNYVN